MPTNAPAGDDVAMTKNVKQNQAAAQEITTSSTWVWDEAMKSAITWLLAPVLVYYHK